MGDHDQSRALPTEPCDPIDEGTTRTAQGHKSWRRDEGVMRRQKRNGPHEQKNPWHRIAQQQRGKLIGLGSSAKHRGQRSYQTALTGRRHDCTRPAKLKHRRNHIAKRAPSRHYDAAGPQQEPDIESHHSKAIEMVLEAHVPIAKTSRTKLRRVIQALANSVALVCVSECRNFFRAVGNEAD
jgi:hypothetical protein